VGAARGTSRAIERRMQKTKPSRKLSLSTATVRALRTDALDRVAGAISGNVCNLSSLCNTGGSFGSASGEDNCHWSYGAC
jgi:hypothetical protein